VSAGKFKFGEWLPDLSDLDNPGVTEAKNVRPVGKAEAGYSPYLPLVTSGAAMTTAETENLIALLTGTAGTNTYIYVGTLDGHLYQSRTGSGTWTDYAPAGTGAVQSLCQYNTLVFAADDSKGIYQQTVGGATNFALVSATPLVQVIGVIGQFLLGGNVPLGTPKPNYLQWSAIADPTNWPTPGSATAIATQAGSQNLHLELGAITGIFGGDQWGVILQTAGITRVTYIGGSNVFQFDTLANGIGMDYPNLGVKAGRQVYFASSRGIYATDGLTLDPIGEDKINRWFIANIVNGNPGLLNTGSVGIDWTNKLIVWNFVLSANNTAVVIYNFETRRFSHAVDTVLANMVVGDDTAFASLGLQGIGQDKKLGTFTGTPGTATLISTEVELNPGGKALVQGFRPQVTGSGTVTCKIGSRMKQSDAVTYTSAITPNSVTGFADALVEASYHRAETDIVGSFTQAMGGEFLSEPSGAF